MIFLSDDGNGDCIARDIFYVLTTQINCTLAEANIKNINKQGRYALRVIARNNLGASRPSEWRLMDPRWQTDEEVGQENDLVISHKNNPCLLNGIRISLFFF